ncbi:MAG: hypothetical protein AAFY67_22745 [Cyanobacteria bacterium J06642_9]
MLQLLPEQVAYLRQVMKPTALPGEVEVIDGEIVDVEIDGMPSFIMSPSSSWLPVWSGFLMVKQSG